MPYARQKGAMPMSKPITIAIAVSLWSALPMIASAGDTAKTGIGSGIGGAAGAAVGGELGGKTGAVVGGAAGGAVGAAATTRGDGRRGAIVGGAVGGAAGAAVGHEAGGKTGAVVGAGLGAGTGAVIGRKLDGDGKPQTNKQVTGAVTVSSAGHSAADQGPCGWKKNKNHPGKGWAKGHSKAC